MHTRLVYVLFSTPNHTLALKYRCPIKKVDMKGPVVIFELRKKKLYKSRISLVDDPKPTRELDIEVVDICNILGC